MTLFLIAPRPQTLRVGDGYPFARIEAAVQAAQPGDAIEVYPSASGYPQTAIRLTKPRITIRGTGAASIVLDGAGFDYSGAGAVPRAIFQFDPEADDCRLEGFELKGSHNASFNGAGVRINEAQNVVVARCDMHDNDMGAMSNGRDGDLASGAGQRFERCHLYHNGNLSDPGYNHNFYLGGASVTVTHCEVDHALTGHNVKSRAGVTIVEYCFIHDSANREIDLVESWNTAQPGTYALLLGNVIVKDPQCAGNRGVIQFGQETGVRNGPLAAVNNTIVTPFASAVIALTSPTVSAHVYANVVANVAQAGPALFAYPAGFDPATRILGGDNWISSGYALPGGALAGGRRYQGPNFGVGPGFQSGDFALPRQSPSWQRDRVRVNLGGAVQGLAPGSRYRGKGKWTSSNETFIGAG